MFSLKNRDRLAEPKDAAGKAILKPALYDPPGAPGRPSAGIAPRPSVPGAVPVREGVPGPAVGLRDEPVHAPAAAAETGSAAVSAAHPAGSKLFVGVNIKLKGVEISDCDVLIIEGHVEASVHSKAMQIAKPGTLSGTALIDVAEIYGEFTGELTARARLVVHGTGRVSGTIRYGQLVVAEGGAISGDVKPIDASAKPASPPRTPSAESRLAPQARGTGAG